MRVFFLQDNFLTGIDVGGATVSAHWNCIGHHRLWWLREYGPTAMPVTVSRGGGGAAAGADLLVIACPMGWEVGLGCNVRILGA